MLDEIGATMETTKKAPGRKKVYATASERQRAYLQRCKDGVSGAAKATDDPGQGTKRLSVLLAFGTAHALNLMAKHKGMTKAALLTQLITDAEKQLTAKMTDEQHDEFYSVKR
jgi:macrodomain Ter protein organizer (MatP/YcbG family)